MRAQEGGRTKNDRQVSSEKNFAEDLENHDYSGVVIDDIKKIIQLFKKRKDAVLRSKYHAHDLNLPLAGFSSLHLYPGEYGNRDIVILYKVHRNDHVVLHKIGNHEYVYGNARKIS